MNGQLAVTYRKEDGVAPYSDKAERFFAGCRHNPKHMKGKCPDAKFLASEKVEGQKKAVKGMRKK